MKENLRKANWPLSDRRALQAYQARKLRRYLRDAVLPFSAYYRALFKKLPLEPSSIRSLEDLQKIPFTSKEDLLATLGIPERARDFVLIPEQRILSRRVSTLCRALMHGRRQVRDDFEHEFRPVFMTATTGRAADPVPFFYSRADLDNLALAGTRAIEIAGATREWRMINMFPFAPHLAFWQMHCAGMEFGAFTVGSGGGKTMGTDGNIRLMKKIQPDALIGMPTFLYHVLQQAVEQNVRCESLKRLVLGGEKAPFGMRRKLRALAAELDSEKVEVLTTYGFTEAKMAWIECPCDNAEQTSGYHLFPDLGIIEVIDPVTGEVLPPGHGGEIVFTPLAARGSVVLRYRTGDLIENGLTFEPCPHCQRRLPRLVGKISRCSELRQMNLDKIKGTLVDFNELEHVLDDAAHVGAWQLELRKLHDDPLDVDELVLHVHKTDGVDDEKLTRQLNEHFSARTEIHPNRIEFHTAEEIRDLQGVGQQIKEQRVVDHRPKPRKMSEALV